MSDFRITFEKLPDDYLDNSSTSFDPITPTPPDSTPWELINSEVFEDKMKYTWQKRKELISTGGFYQSTTSGGAIASGVGSETNFDHTWPFPFALFAVKFSWNVSMEGDQIECLVSPDTTVGGTTSVTAAGNTDWIYVSETVCPNIALGYFIKIGTEDLGRVVEIDSYANRIKCESANTSELPATSLVKFTVKMGYKWVFPKSGIITLGDVTPGGSTIPANTIVRCVYTNNDGASGKEFYYALEGEY